MFIISDPELPYKISSSVEISKIVDDLIFHLYKIFLHNIKVHQQNQTMLQNLKLQMQPQLVPVSDFSILTKPTSRMFVASSDLTPYPLDNLDSRGVIAQGFCGPYNHDPHISRLRTQTRFFTPLSCDIEPDITNPTSSKIVVSSDLGPNQWAGIYSKGLLSQGFCGPFLPNSSCHDFEKLTKYKIEHSTLAKYGGISKVYSIHIRIYLFFCFNEKVRGTKTEQSDGATYGGIYKLYIIQVRIYLFISFTDKVCGTKTEQSNVTTYGRRIHIYIYLRVRVEQSTMATYVCISKLYA